MFEKRLKVVVPYRDRQAHLETFLPHIQDYLDENGIAYHIVIAEQEDGQPFNRGAMKNAGFLLGGDADYTCFHDVDYLPLNADYGWTDDPACLVLLGAEGRPMADGRRVHLDTANFFGGVVLMPDALFAQVHGYSNDYWGWGFEDTDLARRFETAGIPIIRRAGVFCPLAHEPEGHHADGSMNDITALNRVLYARKWQTGQPEIADGLSTLAYEVLARATLVPSVDGNGLCEKITVRLLRS